MKLRKEEKSKKNKFSYKFIYKFFENKDEI